MPYEQEAILAESYYKPIKSLSSGDTDAAFSTTDHVLSGEVRVGGQVSNTRSSNINGITDFIGTFLLGNSSNVGSS